MAFDIAKQHLEGLGLGDRVKVFEVSSATVELAALAVGCEPARIAKTLSFMVDGHPVLVVAAGDVKVDNRRYKDAFGVKDGVEVYLDESLKRFDVVYPACGSANSAVHLTIPDLERASGYKAWVDVCKGWREQENA